MRTVTLFNNVDADTAATSASVQIDQRVYWKMIITKSGTDGNPLLYIEEAYNGGGCLAEPLDYYPVGNACSGSLSFVLDDNLVTIEHNILIGNWIRIRIEPNGTTVGTVNVKFVYKTFV